MVGILSQCGIEVFCLNVLAEFQMNPSYKYVEKKVIFGLDNCREMREIRDLCSVYRNDLNVSDKSDDVGKANCIFSVKN